MATSMARGQTLKSSSVWFTLVALVACSPQPVVVDPPAGDAGQPLTLTADVEWFAGATTGVTCWLSPDDSLLRCLGKTLREFDVGRGELRRVVRIAMAGDPFLRAGAFAPDGSWGVLAHDSGATLVDVATAATRAVPRVGVQPNDLRISPDGTRLLVHLGASLFVIDPKTAAITTELTVEERILEASWSEDGELLVLTASELRTHDAQTGTRLATRPYVDAGSAFYAVSPDGTRVVNTNGAGVQLVDLSAPHDRQYLDFACSTRAVWSADSTLFACHGEASLVVAEASGTLKVKVPTPVFLGGMHFDASNRIVTGGSGLQRFDSDSGEETLRLIQQAGQAEWLGDGSGLVEADSKRVTVRQSDGAILGRQALPPGYLRHIDARPGATDVALAHSAGLLVWNTREAPQPVLSGQSCAFVAWSPDGAVLAYSCSDTQLGHLEPGTWSDTPLISTGGQGALLWQPGAARLGILGGPALSFFGLDGEPGPVLIFSKAASSAVFGPDGEFVLGCTTTGIETRFLATGSQGSGFGSRCHALALSPDGTLLAVFDETQGLRLVDPSSRRSLAAVVDPRIDGIREPLTQHASPASIDWAPDGERFVAVLWGSTIVVRVARR